MANREAWDKIKEIVGTALDLEPVRRAAYLDEACARDEGLRSEVESLIAAHGQAQALSDPAWPQSPLAGGADPSGPASSRAEAERLGLQCIAIMKRVLGPDHPDTLRTMTDLALAYQGQGRYGEAERLDAEILEIQQRVLGPEHEDVLWSMNNLALAYQSEGRYDEAERLHLKTLEIRRRVLGPTHPDTLASLYNLACIAAKRGDRPQAMSWLRQDVDGGDLDFDGMASDPELQALHGPAFDALLAQVRRNAAPARAPASSTSH